GGGTGGKYDGPAAVSPKPAQDVEFQSAVEHRELESGRIVRLGHPFFAGRSPFIGVLRRDIENVVAVVVRNCLLERGQAGVDVVSDAPHRHARRADSFCYQASVETLDPDLSALAK